jgi:hypothetical protein
MGLGWDGWMRTEHNIPRQRPLLSPARLLLLMMMLGRPLLRRRPRSGVVHPLSGGLWRRPGPRPRWVPRGCCRGGGRAARRVRVRCCRGCPLSLSLTLFYVFWSVIAKQACLVLGVGLTLSSGVRGTVVCTRRLGAWETACLDEMRAGGLGLLKCPT